MVAKGLSALFLFCLRLYQCLLSPLLPKSCRYAPSCSEYAIEAIKKHGPFYGAVLTGRRLLRCHPWGAAGFDPVPDTCSKHHHSLKFFSIK